MRSAGLSEDDDELREIVKRALEDDGSRSEATPSGQDALRAFAARRHDVLILDVGLPDADGRNRRCGRAASRHPSCSSPRATRATTG